MLQSPAVPRVDKVGDSGSEPSGPSGIGTSDDPFPAARSSAYRRSYDLRTAEEKDYPHTVAEAKP